MSSKVIIAGGSGFIGTALSWALLNKGYDVVSLDISPPKTSRVMFVEADLSEGIPEHAFLEKPRYIINLAGAPIMGRWSSARKELIYQSRINSTKNIIKLISKVGFRPEALVSASATGFYGDSGTMNVDERSDQGEGFLAMVANDWEEAAREAEKVGVRTTILRNGTVLGSGGYIARMRPFYNLKIVPQLSAGQSCFPWIHEADLVQLYITSMEEPQAPSIINAVAPHITTVGEYSRTVAELIRGKIISMPEMLTFPIFKEMVTELSYSQCVKTEAISTRYKFKYPTVKKAVKEILKR